MSVEENKAIVRRLIEEDDRGNLAIIDELVAPDYVHYLGAKPVWSGVEGSKGATSTWRAAFINTHTNIEDILGEGDRVAVRLSWRGTHTGTIWGYPATGKQVTATQIIIFRIKDGEIVESWEEWGRDGFLEQLAGGPQSGESGA